MPKNILRACGYGRVSTDEEIQINALAVQVEELKETIKSKGWIFTQLYIDEGKSGTGAKKREAYMQLCADLEQDKWDVIVVKSQDRLMRNAKDWYIFVDNLVKNNKKLYFYIENKFYTPDDALITGIKAILAEDYSRELSKKEVNAHATRRKKAIAEGIKDGESLVLTGKTWGYDKVGRKVAINPLEAEMVKKIYYMSAYEGIGSRMIAKRLLNEGYLNHKGNPISEGVVRKIVRNPLYKGTAVMNRISYDFVTKKAHYNKGEDIVYVENAVPPIITEEVWKLANDNMDSRSQTEYSKELGMKRRGLKKGNNKFSGKVFCGYCKKPYWMRTRRCHDGNLIEWSCSNYIQYGRKNTAKKHPLEADMVGKSSQMLETAGNGCDNNHIKNEMLEEILKKYAATYSVNDYESEVKYTIESLNVLFDNDADDKLTALIQRKTDIEKRIDKLLDRLLDDTITNEVYKSNSLRYDEELKMIEVEIETIKKRQHAAEEKVKQINALKSRIEEMAKKHEMNYIDILNCIDKIYIYPDVIEVSNILGEITSFKYYIGKGDLKRNIKGTRPTKIYFNDDSL